MDKINTVKIWIPLTELSSFDPTKGCNIYYLVETVNCVCINVSLEEFKGWANQRQLLKG